MEEGLRHHPGLNRTGRWRRAWRSRRVRPFPWRHESNRRRAVPGIVLDDGLIVGIVVGPVDPVKALRINRDFMMTPIRVPPSP